jgi:hypothetical protein
MDLNFFKAIEVQPQIVNMQVGTATIYEPWSAVRAGAGAPPTARR